MLQMIEIDLLQLYSHFHRSFIRNKYQKCSDFAYGTGCKQNTVMELSLLDNWALTQTHPSLLYSFLLPLSLLWRLRQSEEDLCLLTAQTLRLLTWLLPSVKPHLTSPSLPLRHFRFSPCSTSLSIYPSNYCILNQKKHDLGMHLLRLI